MDYKVHEVHWTPELVSRFWDAMTNSPLAIGNYFSEQVGPGLINWVRKKVPLGSRVLDFGAGPGHLVKLLLELPGIQVSACEYSEASIRQLNNRFRDMSQFEGCSSVVDGHTTFDSGTFDTVFLVETLEHLLPEWREQILKEIWRILNTSGHLVITTPNDENLSHNMTICPECGAVFHRMQHVSRFNEEEITALLARFGFRKICCEAVQLMDFLPGHAWRRFYRRLIPSGQKLPHLIYVGEKT